MSTSAAILTQDYASEFGFSYFKYFFFIFLAFLLAIDQVFLFKKYCEKKINSQLQTKESDEEQDDFFSAQNYSGLVLPGLKMLSRYLLFNNLIVIVFSIPVSFL